MNYDVAIIGGGIHGVGVAQAAAVRGYKTILFEQHNNLGEGTSSRSSKLIHGGLRYLEQFEFSLVHECLTERKYLLRNAPSLVKLKPVYIPIYKNSKRPPWMVRLGLSLYAILGGLSTDTRFKKLEKNLWNQLHGIKQDGLLIVFQYFEAQTDDQQLTKSVMQSAKDYGAELKLNSKVEEIYLNKQHCEVTYTNGKNQSKQINSKTVVNAAGPWANDVLMNVKPLQKTISVDLVQGTHIILPIKLGDEIFYLESPIDQRPIFVLPWCEDTMIGTTESIFEENPGLISPHENEINYLLDSFYYYFPGYKKNNLKIKRKFSGLRVLPKSTKRANQRSRETILLRDRKFKPRLLSIFGGKLTAYRATSEQVIDKLNKSLPDNNSSIDTKNLKLG